MKRVLVGVDGSAAAGAALGWAAGSRHESAQRSWWQTSSKPGSPKSHPMNSTSSCVTPPSGSQPSGPNRFVPVRSRIAVSCSPARRKRCSTPQCEKPSTSSSSARGHGGFAALHIGSVAHHLAHHTRRPLAIVPEPGAGATVDRVVVGVDGSEGSAAAVRWCAALTGMANVEAVAAYVFEPGADWLPRSLSDAWREVAKMSEWVTPLRAAGIEVRTRIIEDAHPVAALTAAVEDVSGGLIVVGTRGLSGVAGLRLGRVPLQLVHHSQLPVVLVPPAADEKESPESADS